VASDSSTHDLETLGTPSAGPASLWEEVPFSLDRDQKDLLLRHLTLVLERNKVMNLTRITDPEEALYLHVLDSLLLKDAFDAAPSGPFVDIGSGAGYPGIPLAIVTGRPATLVDSVKKKAQATRDFVEELGLTRARAEGVRIEDLARKERSRYSVACARAVAPAGVLVEYAAPLLRKGGRLVVAKAYPEATELEQAEVAADLCGMAYVSRETFELPRGLGHREVISYEKVANPRIRLPRAVGQARHQPLG